MRVAIDARGINCYKGTGIATYTSNLLENILSLDSENYYHLYWSGGNYKSYAKQNSKLLLSSNKYHTFFEERYFPSNLDRENIDVFHVPQNGIGLSENIHCKKIVTIHDLIPYVMPETVGKGYLKKFLMEMPRIIELADAIITVSSYSKNDILRFFPINPEKIFVTPLAASKKYTPLDSVYCKTFLREHYMINKPFILYIGGFSPRKNVNTLIRSFSQIYSSLKEEYNLVIVGATNKDQFSYLNELGTNLDISKHIIFTNYVPEEELPIFYNGCEVFAYPSLYEGFGLPLLEAMSCGAPVISSNITSIPEVVRGAGILIDPLNIDDLSENLMKVLCNSNLRNSFKIKGLEQAKNFTWKTTAKSTIAVYENM